MAFIGNLLWFVFGGFIGGTLWMLMGLLMCCTVVGIPVGIACFRIGRFAYCPFGKELVPAEWMGEKRILGTGLIQFFWIVLPGICLALWHALVGVVFCCTIICIPWGIACFHLAGASFAPLGKRVVAKDYAKVLKQKYYESKANAALGTANAGPTIVVNNQSSPIQPPAGNAP
ncbi:MAG: YccF family protein [Kiritimatiellae bacterium]|nr:YccF family protein [Kiritimatiellia bacterium]